MARQASGAKVIVDGSILTGTELLAISLRDSSVLLERKNAHMTKLQRMEDLGP